MALTPATPRLHFQKEIDMPVTLIRGLLTAVLASSFAVAQEPAASHDETIQALLKEVHALRVALERNSQIGPKIQIALARMQLQEQRVRNATQHLQEIRDRTAEIQRKRTETAERIKQFETVQAETIDPNARKQMDLDFSEMKAQVERLGTLEQQLREKEAEANSVLLGERTRWNEANDALTSIERMLGVTQP